VDLVAQENDMLCLSRKKDEKVVIGGTGGGTVQVLEIQGDKVRLGFDFPKSVPVHREEVQAQIDAKEAQDDESGEA
jgi:carbon storage regulator